MMNIRPKACVIGAGGHARAVVSELLLQASYNIQCVFDEQPLKHSGEKILGIDVVHSENIVEEIAKKQIGVAFIAYGCNSKRKKYFTTLKESGIRTPNLLARNAYISEFAQLGRGNYVAGFVHIGPEAKVGSNCIINTGSNIEHEAIVGDHCHIAPGSVLCGRAKVNDSVLVGAKSVILDNIQVAEKSNIGAGAVVVKSCLNAGLTWVGVPARVKGEES